MITTWIMRRRRYFFLNNPSLYATKGSGKSSDIFRKAGTGVLHTS